MLFYCIEKINSNISETLSRNPEWLIIDEVGKLELKEKGFYSAVKKIIDQYQNKQTAANVLLVVRDSLCDKVISFFKINKYTIIHQMEDL